MSKFLVGYLFAGFATAVWTAHRASEGKAAFNGFGNKTVPALALSETVLAWPYALYVGLTEGA